MTDAAAASLHTGEHTQVPEGLSSALLFLPNLLVVVYVGVK